MQVDDTCQRRGAGELPGGIRALAQIGAVGLLWAFILVAAASLAGAMRRERRAAQEDFAVYYLLAQTMREGHNPYTLDLAQAARANGADLHDISRGSEPPTFLLLFEPLTLLPLWTAYWAWQGINLFCLAATLLLLLRHVSRFDPALAAALAGLAILYPPVGWHFWMGQSKLPLLLLLAFAMRWMECGRDAEAGLALALAALLRIFPLVVIGYPVLQRRWRVAGWAITGLLVGGALTAACAGSANIRSFVSSISFLTGHWWEHDIALRAFVARTLWAVCPAPALAPRLVRYIIVGAVDLGALAATLKATMAYGERTDPDRRVFSLWIATSVFLLPVAWDYDLVLMLIPFAQIAGAAARGVGSRRALRWAALSYLLILLWECVIGHVLPSGAALRLTLGEGGTFSMCAGWLAAYWFTLDGRGADALAMRDRSQAARQRGAAA